MNCQYLFSKEKALPANLSDPQKTYVYQFKIIMRTAIINKVPDRYMHHINIDDSDSLYLVIEAIKNKIIPALNKQNEELEQDAARFQYAQGETLKEFFQTCEELRSELIMHKIKSGEDEEQFMELVLQALETHPLANEFNTIFVGTECATFERLKKLLNTSTLRASKRSPDHSPDRRRSSVRYPTNTQSLCSFHSRNG